jgi:hypothetical protein
MNHLRRERTAGSLTFDGTACIYSLVKLLARGLLCGEALLLSQGAGPMNAQPSGEVGQQLSSAHKALQPDPGIATFRVTTRDLDLKPEDVQVSESFVSLDSTNPPHRSTM